MSYDLTVAADLSNVEFDHYVQRQLAAANMLGANASAFQVIDCSAVDPDHFGGGLCRKFPVHGYDWQWKTTAFIATADHLVLDGALFQSILFHIARAALGSQSSNTDVSDATLPAAVGASSFATIRLPQMKSNSDIMAHIVPSGGIRSETSAGTDTILLTKTIQQWLQKNTSKSTSMAEFCRSSWVWRTNRATMKFAVVFKS